MEYRELTRQEYDRKLRMVIIGAEGLHARVQDVGDNRATIGWGYTFNRSNNARIWRQSGITLTPEQWQTIAEIDAARVSDRTRIGLTFSRMLDAAESDRLLRASMAEYESPADRLQMPLSDERIALVSLAYNRGVGMLTGIPSANVPEHAVMDAIRNGDRAEAWFQIRYNCWGSNNAAEAGLRKRRFAEAHVFGLYDDPGNVTLEDAISAYRMLELHREEIERVESAFGVTVDGDAANPNRIAQANRDYPALVTEYGVISEISDALAPARDAILRELRLIRRNAAGGLADTTLSTDQIRAAAGRELRDRQEVDREYPIEPASGRSRSRNAALRREQYNTTTEHVGDAGDQILRARGGDDVLLGRTGRGHLEGGKGFDTYVIAGGDVVSDEDGAGLVYWGDERLTGGVRWQGHRPGNYLSANGRWSYTVDAGDLIIKDNLAPGPDRQHAVISNFRSGQLGIELTDCADDGRCLRDAPRLPGEPEHAPEPDTDATLRRSRTNDSPLLCTGDPALDRLACALLSGNESEFDRACADIANSPLVRELELGARELAAAQHGEEVACEQLHRRRASVTVG